MSEKNLTPNQRQRPDVDPADWDVVVQWRPFVYRRLAQFGTRAMKRPVSWRGEIGSTDFEWMVPGGPVYGVEPRALMQDLEYRALEAAASAAHTFDAGRGVKFVTFLGKVIDFQLMDEMEDWRQTSSSASHFPLEYASDLETLEEFDADPDEGDGLDDATRAALQEAMGALTAKEAWALWMSADGTPIGVIQERLGHDHEQSTYALIARAKKKAASVFVDAAPEEVI